MKIDLIKLANNNKANSNAVLLNISRDFERNYSELVTDKEKFNEFCSSRADKFIYPDGKKYAVVIYLQQYLLNPDESKLQQIINSLN